MKKINSTLRFFFYYLTAIYFPATLKNQRENARKNRLFSALRFDEL